MKYPLSIVAAFIWIGFVCAISFMESWLKFRAAGVTTSIGLNLGKIIFGTLNKMEWVFLIAIFSELIFKKVSMMNMLTLVLFIPLIILILQSFWLLPVLNERADLLIQRKTPESSHIHLVYVGIEVIKIASLFLFGFYLLKEKI